MGNASGPLRPLKPHTRAKHTILDRYLGAWFPILATQSKQLVYFDGFAGPGRYAGGETGSPLIALNAARRHFARLRDNSLLKGLPFRLVDRLLKRRFREALITFMTFAAQKWVTELPEIINDLIGDPQAAAVLAAAPSRTEMARSMYLNALRSSTRLVRFLKMRSLSDQPIYDVFFATSVPSQKSCA